jgi:hypothetical protein
LLEFPIFSQTQHSNTFVLGSHDHYIFAVGHSQERNVGPRIGIIFLQTLGLDLWIGLGLGFCVLWLLGGRRKLPPLLRWGLVFRCGSCARTFIFGIRIYGLRPHIKALPTRGIISVEVATGSGQKDLRLAYWLPVDIAQALERVLEKSHNEPFPASIDAKATELCLNCIQHAQKKQHKD